jgi:hypothetical protein
MLTRMETIKLGKYFEDETQSLSDVEKILSKSTIDVKLRDSTNTFREMGDVIGDVAKKWNYLNETDQSAVATAIAGVRQRENFITLMRNWDQFLKAEQIQVEANGLAWQRYGIYLNSTEAAINKFRASWEKLASDFLNSDALRDSYKVAATILDIVDKVGLLTIALGVLSGFMSTKLTPDLISGIKSFIMLGEAEGLAAAGATAFSIASGAIVAVGVIAAVYGLVSAYKALNASMTDVYATFESNSVNVKQNIQAIETLASSYAAVANKEEKSAEDKQNLLDMQATLNTKYNEGGQYINIYTAAVDNNTDAINKNIAKIKERTIAQQELYLAINKSAYEEAKKYLETSTAIDRGRFKGTPKELIDQLTEEILKGHDINNVLRDQLTNLDKLVTAGDKIKTEYEAQLKTLQEIKKEQSGTNIPGVSSNVKEQVALIEDLIKVVGTLNSKVKDSTGIYKEYADSGELSVESMSKLQGIFPDYLELLSVEEGHLKLNVKAYKEKTLALIEDQIQTAKNSLAQDSNNAALKDQIALLQVYKNQVLESLYKIDLEAKIKSETEAVKKQTDTLKDQEKAYKSKIEAEIKDYEAQKTALEKMAKAYKESIDDQIKVAEKKKKSLQDAEDSYQKSVEKTITKLKEENDTQKKLLQDQLDSYKTIIDARIRILDLQQSEKEYQDEIADKNKGIANVQAELLALQFDTSEEANAKRLQLQDDLAKKQKDLEKTQYGHSIDTQKDALNQEYDDYETMIKDKMKLLEDSHDVQIKILENEQKAYKEDYDLRIKAIEDQIDKLKEEEDAYNKSIEDKKEVLDDFIQSARSNLEAYTADIDGQIEGMNNKIQELQNQMTLLPEGFNNFKFAILDTNTAIDGTMAKLRQVGDIINSLPGTSFSGSEPKTPELYGSAGANIGWDWSSLWNELLSSITSTPTGYGVNLFNYPKHHSGAEGGFIGQSQSKSSDEFLALMKNGELPITTSQMDDFMTKTLPNLAGVAASNNNGNVNIQKFMDITVQGNLDSSTLPKLEKIIERAKNEMIKSLGQRGIIRSANTFFL